MLALLCRLLAMTALVAMIAAEPATAGTLVEFPNLPGERPAQLLGYLARPDAGLAKLAGGDQHNADLYPAVVVLHGGSGISSHSIGIADRLGAWGYVALAVDSLGSRGITGRGRHGATQAFDAYAALRYLAGLEEVDAARIAVLGQSMGGIGALQAVDHDMAAQYFTERLRAAVAYYPGCGVPAATMTAPVLILIGEADQWNSAAQCHDMVRRARPDSAPIELTVYPGIHHAFDVVQLQPGRGSDGHWVEYNEPAAKDAEARVKSFLATHLGPGVR